MNIAEVISVTAPVGRMNSKTDTATDVVDPETAFADLMAEGEMTDPELVAEVDTDMVVEAATVESVEFADQEIANVDLPPPPQVQSAKPTGETEIDLETKQLAVASETPEVQRAETVIDVAENPPPLADAKPGGSEVAMAVPRAVVAPTTENAVQTPAATTTETATVRSDAAPTRGMTSDIRNDPTTFGSDQKVAPTQEMPKQPAIAVPVQEQSREGQPQRDAKPADTAPRAERIGSTSPEITTAQPAQHYNISPRLNSNTQQLNTATSNAMQADAMSMLDPETGDVRMHMPTEVRAQTTAPSTSLASTQMSAPQKAIVHQIVASLSKPHDGSIRIRLDPPELGRITLQITPSEHGAIASVSAERPEVLDLIKRNADMLTAEMKEAGFQDLNFQFSQQAETDDGGQEEASSPVYVTKDEDTTINLASQNAADINQMRADGTIDIRL